MSPRIVNSDLTPSIKELIENTDFLPVGQASVGIQESEFLISSLKVTRANFPPLSFRDNFLGDFESFATFSMFLILFFDSSLGEQQETLV